MPSYFFKFNVQVKGRWINRMLIDVMVNNFVMKPYTYYEQAIELGVITVNNQIVQKSYILRNTDSIQHLVHYHEPEPKRIEIISIENDYLVVNKPCGIACHPTGGYNLFSVTKILEHYGNLSCINRLDVVTSGVLILSFKDAQKYHKHMIQGKIDKKYLAKVKGKFPPQVKVDRKIEKNKQNFSFVSENGKESVTFFRLLCYKNGYSLVECHPITGRSHQIRVHLKFLGFPIINDPVYNENPESYNSPGKEETQDPEYWPCAELITDHNEIQKFALKKCQGTDTRAFRNRNTFICLHAYKYTFDGKEHVATPPQWTRDFDVFE